MSQDTLSQITLNHMSMEIDIASILKEHHPKAAEYIAIYIVQQFYNQITSKLGEEADKRLFRRALDHAKFYTLQRLPELKSETEAALYFLLDEAERTGWFHSDFIGFDSLEELVLAAVDPESTPKSEVSDWNFIAKETIPAARSFGMDADTLFAANLQVKKLRGSVPIQRQILNELAMGDKTEEEARAEFRQVIEWVADPNITYTQFETNVGKREPAERLRAINVYDVAIPGGESWIVIPVETETEKRIVERMLNGRMNKKLRPLPWLVEKIQGLIRPI